MRYHNERRNLRIAPRTLNEAFGPYATWHQPTQRKRSERLYYLAAFVCAAIITILLLWRG